ncbi:DUF2510 domain-containing protein [Psychromicrobium lacuslunae]|uniref:DUF2510 domain-containing protein n=1 Tax=Psychromicrobium lacuslunae TaxID=1618207 RepID=A0A0D4C0W0_9MICC|nr:DUF2510 domain-containing protein [Psychromicrobium lacuslunae]AJT42189.1 hypothetical protein UM93_12990 [Psychromicrobium lacuslunae]
MSAAPGWYDAGTPGRLRWWDGTQWTEHESVAQSGPATPVPGWYQTRNGSVRWWDGHFWTGMRFRKGVPGTDWAAIEQPSLAWGLGVFFLFLAAAQFGLGALTRSFSINGLTTFLLAVLWLAMAAQTTAVRRTPSPTGEPLVADLVRPLPGEQEAPGSGWYPVARNDTHRWWTGQRWAQYTSNRFGIRPSFHGRQAYRRYLVVIAVIGAIALISAILGLVFLSLGSSAEPRGLSTVLGISLLAGGVLFLILSSVLLAMRKNQRNVLLLPPAPPQPTY